MSDNNKEFGLSRRQLLGGLGIVGVASAGAGLGTTAYFSDQQTFQENTLTAGTLELIVTQQIAGIDQDGIGPDELAYFGDDANSEGEAVVTDQIEITDAKPGDEYEFCWEVEIDGNPGFAKVAVPEFSEMHGVDAGNVELDDLYDIDDEDDLTTIGAAATAVATLTLSDGEEIVVYENGLEGLLALLSEGVPVPAELVEDGPNGFCHDPNSPVEFCVVVTIPTTVGNELQGASSTFDIEFCAEQCRHNEVGSFLGQDVDSSTDEGFVDVAGEFDQKTMNARGRYGAGGGSQTWELGLADDLTPATADANYAWDDGESVPFSFVYDGSEGTFAVDGVEISETLGAPQGRLGFTLKADGASIDVENVVIVANNGAPLALNGPNAVSATSAGNGRDVQYLLVDTDPSDLTGSFAVYGDVTMSPDTGGSDEHVAFDLVVE